MKDYLLHIFSVFLRSCGFFYYAMNKWSQDLPKIYHMKGMAKFRKIAPEAAKYGEGLTRIIARNIGHRTVQCVIFK